MENKNIIPFYKKDRFLFSLYGLIVLFYLFGIYNLS